MSSLPLDALAAPAGFRSDLRFSLETQPPPDPVDPVARARAEGYAAGLSEARSEAMAEAQAQAAARGKIELGLARLDAEQAEVLRQRLLATVTALCEAAIAPLALDREALRRRIEKASAMLLRAEDDKMLRLHPDDLKLVAANLPDDLAVREDAGLERGALRIETSAGGVEDGPAHWRRAISEAIAQC